MRLPLLCRNSRAVTLAKLGLMAGWLADEMQVNFKFLKFMVDQIFKLFVEFNTVTTSLEQYECIFSWYFQQKSVLRWSLEV